MKSSSPWVLAWGFSGLPVGDEGLVGAFSALGSSGFVAASLLVVVGRAGLAVIAAAGGRAGGELELAALMGDQGGPGEGVVLVFGDQVLMRVYAKCMTGLEDVWISRMDDALYLEGTEQPE